MKRAIGVKHKQSVLINGVLVRVKIGTKRGRRVVLELYYDDQDEIDLGEHEEFEEYDEFEDPPLDSTPDNRA
jgi:hypothetical protein